MFNRLLAPVGVGKISKESPNWKGCGELRGHLIASYKEGAKSRKLKFSVTAKFLWNLFLKQNRKCAITGIDLTFVKNFTTASLDRIDSNKGYIKNNVQWVHKIINMMKYDHIQQDFINWCHLVSSHNK